MESVWMLSSMQLSSEPVVAHPPHSDIPHSQQTQHPAQQQSRCPSVPFRIHRQQYPQIQTVSVGTSSRNLEGSVHTQNRIMRRMVYVILWGMRFTICQI